jgi:DNA-binding NtrC family response regulator
VSIMPKVLIVDDEERLRNTMRKLLAVEGLEADSAGSGEEAVEKLRAGKFDVIILDVRMPGMTGVETLAEIKKIDPEVEVIILTGYASVDTAKDIMKLGAYDYLLKPYSKEELMDRIDAAFDRKLAAKKLMKKDS